MNQSESTARKYVGFEQCMIKEEPVEYPDSSSSESESNLVSSAFNSLVKTEINDKYSGGKNTLATAKLELQLKTERSEDVESERELGTLETNSRVDIEDNSEKQNTFSHSIFQDSYFFVNDCGEHEKSVKKNEGVDDEEGSSQLDYYTLSSDKAFLQSKEFFPRKEPMKSFQCAVCKKAFPRFRELERHKRTHTGEKPFSCDICGKSFVEERYLPKHKITHTGEKPFSCIVCGKSFSFSVTLTKHKRVHTGEKPYNCDVCGKSFSDSGGLSAHKRIHTGEKPFTCGICSKSFTCAATLIKHRQIHTDERPFKCDICPKTFNFLGNLNRHKRTHTGIKPYACELCDKSFADVRDLNKHKIKQKCKKKPKKLFAAFGKI